MIHRVPNPPMPESRPGAGGVRAVLFPLVVGLWAIGCTPVGAPTPPAAPAAPSIPSIVQGSGTPYSSRAASDLLLRARDSLNVEAWEGAREAAQGVVLHYPGAPGSGEALEILAQAALGLGEYEEAAEAASRYLTLFEPAHPLIPRALLLSGQVLAANGDQEGSLRSLLRLSAESPQAVLEPALALMREILDTHSPEDLRRLAETVSPTSPAHPVLATSLAVSLSFRGEGAEAREWARTAMAGPIAPPEAELARGILEGNLEEVIGTPVLIGAILPRTGVSPGLLEYGEWILEGIQVAIAEYQGELGRPINLEVMDDEGAGEGARGSVGALENMGTLGIVGPLTLDALAGAAAGRTHATPIVSPFVALPGEEAPGVFSLEGPDLSGAEMVARYAWDLGLEEVAVVQPRTALAQMEAEAFKETFQALGGFVPPEIVFDSGATFFQVEFDQVATLLPDGIFLPLMPADINLLAPQFTYYGLDTLGIQVLGTSGWTDEVVVRDVDSRHTDGVIASTIRTSQDETEAYQRFRAGYEDLFQKTLRSQVPAFGYDAAALIFQALRSRPSTSGGVLSGFDGILDFPGATGRFTFEDGLLLRQAHLVRIQNHELIYISPRFD